MPCCEALSWEVTLPQRSAGSLATSAKPQATITLNSDQGGEEKRSVPLAVGRALKAKADADELHPQSRAELLHQVDQTSARCAALRIERLINRREYASQEINSKLQLDGYPAYIREPAIARAIDCGLVSDARYAEAFVREKVAAGWGILRIERELKQRGIELAELPGWPEEFLGEQTEDDRAYELARHRRLAEKNAYEKLVRYLCGRGFSQACAMRVARRVTEQAEAATV